MINRQATLDILAAILVELVSNDSLFDQNDSEGA
jgi:hypothetical protein